MMSYIKKTVLACCISLLLGATAAQAQDGGWQTDTTDPAAGSQIGPYLDSGLIPAKPNVADSAAITAYYTKLAEARNAQVKAAMQRKGEEAIYKARGEALELLNKPIKLFEMTCTTKGKKTTTDTNPSDDALLPTFKFNKDIWKAFCLNTGAGRAAKSAGASNLKAAGAAIGGSLKCAFETYLQQVFAGTIDKLEQFQERTFCKVLTDFVDRQLNQCLSIKINLPPGQFPGFPAFNQCLFGRMNLEIDASTGKTRVAGGGPVLPDVISVHGFNYNQDIGDYDEDAYAGSEQQLLGKEGASSLMKEENWTAKKVGTVAGLACGKLDPELVQILTDYPMRSNDLKYGEFRIMATRGLETQGKVETRTLANWEPIWNENTKVEYNYLNPPTNVGDGPAALMWTKKGGYTYLANCYGFERLQDNSTCVKLVNPDSAEIMCSKEDPATGCCDPDKTDCLAQNIVWEGDVCVDGKVVKDPVTGKNICQQLKHAAGDAKICEAEGVCCNPSLNDCQAIGVNICEKYIPPKQCLVATPEQLTMFDPVYSRITVKPDMNVDGVMCCSTPWCNLCPQDLIGLGNNIDKGETIYIRESELANVPAYCLGNAAYYKTTSVLNVQVKTSEKDNWSNPVVKSYTPFGKSNYKDIMNHYRKTDVFTNKTTEDYTEWEWIKTQADTIEGLANLGTSALGYRLYPVPDKVYDNTQEACNLMTVGAEGERWSGDDIKRVFRDCPKKKKKAEFWSGLADSLGIGGAVSQPRDYVINVFVGSQDCPDGVDAKPYIEPIILHEKCTSMGSVTRYPMPITKLPRIEGMNPIGLCSDLNLCPAAVPADQNPYSAKEIMDAIRRAFGKLGQQSTTGQQSTETQSGVTCRNSVTGATERCSGSIDQISVPTDGGSYVGSETTDGSPKNERGATPDTDGTPVDPDAGKVQEGELY